jgi:hypothetical protein
MVPARKERDEQAQDFVANDGRVTTLPEVICNKHSLTTRSSICLMFSICVWLQNCLSLSPIAVPYSPLFRQQPLLPSCSDQLQASQLYLPLLRKLQIQCDVNKSSPNGTYTKPPRIPSRSSSLFTIK